MTEDNKTLRELISVTPINSDLISARLSIKKGEQWAFIGPNGCGKTFLSSLISGKIRQNDWQIEYDFISKRPLYENVKVLQFKDIYTVSESGKMYYQQRFNSAENDFPPVSDFLKKYGDEAAIRSLSVRFGIEDLLDKPVIQLSSGELRKVHIIRVLLGNPEIIILDNPYIGLDVGSRILLDETLQSIINSGKTQIVLLLSDPSDLPQYITNVLEINKNNWYNEKKSLVLPEESLPTEDKADYENVIEMEHINIKYGVRTILKDLNWTVKRGEKWALLGENGSGKSTLLDLLPRFYEVQQGGVFIDGINVKDMKMCDLRAFMGNVNQEAILFNDSFFANIAFGVENATAEHVEAAARIANAHDFIIASEQGYQTGIGDRGSKLSGGQRQRISIARAILKNPPILILDEATSSLDTESEKLVQEALENLMKNRTTLVVAHRLSTIKRADEILVLHEGEIVERGKHEELLALGGYYKRLCDMQSF